MVDNGAAKIRFLTMIKTSGCWRCSEKDYLCRRQNMLNQKKKTGKRKDVTSICYIQCNKFVSSQSVSKKGIRFAFRYKILSANILQQHKIHTGITVCGAWGIVCALCGGGAGTGVSRLHHDRPSDLFGVALSGHSLRGCRGAVQHRIQRGERQHGADAECTRATDTIRPKCFYSWRK